MSSLIKNIISKFNCLKAWNKFSELEVHENPFRADQNLAIKTK